MSYTKTSQILNDLLRDVELQIIFHTKNRNKKMLNSSFKIRNIILNKINLLTIKRTNHNEYS